MNTPNPPRPAANSSTPTTSTVKGSPLPPPVDPLLARSARNANTAGTRPTIPAARTPRTAIRPTSTAKPSTAAPTASPQPPVRKPGVGKRVKPARAAKMVSLGLSAVSTVAMAGLFARHDVSADDGNSIVLATPATAGTTATTANTTATTATTGDATVTSTAGATATTAATTAAPASTGSILDGTYVGGASQNRWGTVQVQAVYSGGQLIDVQILQYPDGDNRSVSINQRALPTLINAAISAQSANVSNISGATYTARSYVASLQSAIDAAKASSGITG